MQPYRPEPKNPTLRYWLARFKTMAKPKFWLSSLGLVGLLVFAWEFSQRPEWRQAILNNRSNPEPSAEEQENQAIGADIDSLPLLNADFKASQAKLDAQQREAESVLKKLQKQEKNRQADAKRLNQLSLESLFGKANKTLATTPRLTPGLGGSQGLGGASTTNSRLSGSGLSRPSLTGSGLTSGLSTIGNAVRSPGLTATSLLNRNALSARLNNGSLITSGNQRQTASNNLSNNVLSNALNRYSPARPNPNAPFQVNLSEPTPTATPSSRATQPIAGTGTLNPTPTTATATTPPTAGSSAINPALLSAPRSGLNSFTSLNRNSGTTPTAVPSTITTSIRRSTSNSSLRVPRPASIRSTSSVSIPVAPGSTPLPPGTALATPNRTTTAPRDIPFTAPRSIPGRRIGGGQIGTFSNP